MRARGGTVFRLRPRRGGPMAAPLKKIVGAEPPRFELRRLPAMLWGALLGALKALARVSTIAFIVVALALIAASYLYVDRPVATWLHKFERSAVTGFFQAITNLGS